MTVTVRVPPSDARCGQLYFREGGASLGDPDGDRDCVADRRPSALPERRLATVATQKEKERSRTRRRPIGPFTLAIPQKGKSVKTP